MTSPEEVTKDSEHVVHLFPGIDKYADKIFTQDEKHRMAMIVRQFISEAERTRYGHEMIVNINKDKPRLEDEQKQKDRDQLIYQHEKAIEVFDKDLEIWENILKKLG